MYAEMKKSADARDIKAQWDLAKAYASKYNPTPLHKESCDLYEQLANGGHVQSQAIVALNYFYGSNGIDVDLKKAHKYFDMVKNSGAQDIIDTLDRVFYNNADDQAEKGNPAVLNRLVTMHLIALEDTKPSLNL